MGMGDLSTFCSLLQSLASIVCSSCRGHFTSFAKFIPRYVIFFEAIVNGIIFLYSFSICLLLVYKKATDFLSWFCILLLCWNYFVSRRFQVEFLGSLRYKIMSSENRDSLTTSLLICIPFISSCCLIALARNSRTILNKSGGEWTSLSCFRI
jgi:hypothetical protein